MQERGEDIVRHGNESIEEVDWSQIDLGLSVKYRHIISKEVLSTTPFLNLHNSYLPWCRGANTSYWQLVEGCPAGVTLHWMDEGIDTGRIIFQRKCRHILWWYTEESLYHDLDTLAFDLFRECWKICGPDSWPPGRKQSSYEAMGSYHSVKDYENR